MQDGTKETAKARRREAIKKAIIKERRQSPPRKKDGTIKVDRRKPRPMRAEAEVLAMVREAQITCNLIQAIRASGVLEGEAGMMLARQASQLRKKIACLPPHCYPANLPRYTGKKD
jgi:hypothetical protein